MISRQLCQIRTNALFTTPRMASLAVLRAEIARAPPVLRATSSARPEARWRFRWWRLSSVLFRIRGRGHDCGGGEAGPGQRRQKRRRERKGALAETHHGAAVDEGNQEQRKHRDAWQHHRSNHLQWAFEEFYRLEQEQEIPFGPRDVGGICRDRPVCPSGASATTARVNRMINAIATPTVSLKTCSGKNFLRGAVSSTAGATPCLRTR